MASGFEQFSSVYAPGGSELLGEIYKQIGSESGPSYCLAISKSIILNSVYIQSRFRSDLLGPVYEHNETRYERFKMYYFNGTGSRSEALTI